MSDSARETSELLLEIGTEEIPGGYIDPALAFVEMDLARALTEARIAFGHVRVDGTPRRLVAIVTRVALRQADAEEEVTGPAWGIAFSTNDDGSLRATPAGEGFLRKNGLAIADVFPKETKKGPVVAARKREAGRPSAEVLPALLEALIARIPTRKQMRWADKHIHNGQLFARPVQWLLALFDGAPLTVRFADVTSGSTTRGHRYHAPAEVVVRSVAAYEAALARGHVVLSRAERKLMIVQEAQRLAAAEGGELVADNELLELVKNLVEKPWPLLGRFERAFLEVPRELLISEMREHQKYFAVADGSGQLLPCFVVVAGADSADKAGLARGNARVLRARFEDGAFYFRTDRERSLASRVADLDKLVFHKELGHYGEKAARIERVAVLLVDALAETFAARGFDATRIGSETARAALLCKADLTSGVVNEFPELQGIMGRHYALRDGEPADVAQGIDEHYAPRHAGAALPRTDVGALVGIADRFDTIAGILGIGKAPTGSADPFALRRAAIAILTIAIERGYRFSLASLATTAVAAYRDQGRLAKVDVDALGKQVVEFLRGRVRGVLIEHLERVGSAGADDIVDAAIGARGGVDDLPDVAARATALARMRSDDAAAFAALAATFKRVGNIVKKARDDGHAIAAALPSVDVLQTEAERSLRDAVEGVDASSSTSTTLERSHEATLQRAAALKPSVDRFFNDVMVMVDDPQVRAARLALLGRIESLLVDVADFTRLQAG